MKKAKKTSVLFISVISVLLASLCVLLTSCSSGKNALEYKGYKISEGMYSYWMKSWKDYYLNYYTDVEDTEEYWNSENSEGVANKDYMNEQIKTRIFYYIVSLKLFDDYKLSLDEDTKEKIQTDINDQTDHYGSKSAFNDYLKETYGININTLEKIYTIEEKYRTVFQYLYGTDGKKTATPEELDNYYQTYFVRVKYVMFLKDVKYAYDEEGNKITNPQTGYYEFEDLTDEEKQQVKDRANEVFEAVKGGEEIDKYLEEYMKEFGYDSEKYPNGYYISADNYTLHTVDVTSAALDMNVGETRLIENESCYFVLQKFDLIDKAYASLPDSNQFTELVSYANNLKFTAEFNTYIPDIVENEKITSKYTVEKI